MTVLWKNHIAACRIAAKMTMEQLAAAMEPPSSKGMISLYESGKRRPRQTTLEAIAKALKRTPGELIDGVRDDRLLDDAEPAVAIPILGEVPAGPWREEVRSPRGWEHVARSEVTRNSYALKISGDSMDRIVKDRATIIVDPDDRDLFHQRLFVVRGPDGVTFKQYLDAPARLVPCSTNPEHKTIAANDREYEVVGRVKKVMLDPAQAALE